jgi:uncharacterized damage-inducible protein DinB
MQEFNQTEIRRVSRDLVSLTDEDLDCEVTHQAGEQAETHSRTRWHLLFHAANHCVHHRDELGLVLASLGASPGELNFAVFLGNR